MRSKDTTEGVRHAQTIMAGLSQAEHIRPIFDLGHRVLEAIPIEKRTDKAVTELRDCVAKLDASA